MALMVGNHQHPHLEVSAVDVDDGVGRGCFVVDRKRSVAEVVGGGPAVVHAPVVAVVVVHSMQHLPAVVELLPHEEDSRRHSRTVGVVVALHKTVGSDLLGVVVDVVGNRRTVDAVAAAAVAVTTQVGTLLLGEGGSVDGSGSCVHKKT